MAVAGKIVINLSAGTSQFIMDMEKANASVKRWGASTQQAGAHGVSSMQATSASLRVLEGGFTNNLRAAERFTASVLGLGPMLQAAFPVIGAIAFTGLIIRLGEELKKVYAQSRGRMGAEHANRGSRVCHGEPRDGPGALRRRLAQPKQSGL